MTPVRQAVILAGGAGTRLGKLTATLPKPLAPVAGRPFLDYLLVQLRLQGIREVVLLAGYKSAQIISFAESRSTADFQVIVAKETEPLGTGGALRHSANLLQNRFLVCNGDTLVDFNLAALDIVSSQNILVTRWVDDASRYGAVTVEERRVTGFSEKGRSGPGFISAGVAILTVDAVSKLPDGPSSLEQDLLPVLAAAGTLEAFPASGLFIDIGIPSSFHDAQSKVPDWYRKPIAFLDRDGVLNIDLGHVHRHAEFQWIDGAREAVRYLNDTGYYTVLVTNQAGIAKGLYTEACLAELHQWMLDELWKAGAHLDAVYYCPHHVEGTIQEYRRDSYFRKPSPGMIFQAFKDLPSRVDGSFVVGDKETDQIAAFAAGLPFLHFRGGSLLAEIKTYFDRTRGNSHA